MAAGHAETQWFARHRSTPITELPAHWPDDYRRLVEARIELIGRRRDLALIERPECKRRWATEPWDKQQERALRTWLLDRCEARHLWFAPDADGDEQPAVPVDVIVPDPTGPASGSRGLHDRPRTPRRSTVADDMEALPSRGRWTGPDGGHRGW